jgi:hypothetical protein
MDVGIADHFCTAAWAAAPADEVPPAPDVVAAALADAAGALEDEPELAAELHAASARAAATRPTPISLLDLT